MTDEKHKVAFVGAVIVSLGIAYVGVFAVMGAFAFALKIALKGAGAFVGSGIVATVAVAGMVAVAVKRDRFFEVLIKFLEVLIKMIDFITNRETQESKIAKPSRYKLLKLSEFFFSTRTQKEVFLQVMADWDEEIYEALKNDKDVNLFMINVRNIYSFLVVMWQKSPIGDLIEFVRKSAK